MGKAIMAMLFVFIIVSIGGGVAQGTTTNLAASTLITTIDEDDTTIEVNSTEGFADYGFIQIGNEIIGYSNKTATTFVGSVVQPMVRGAQETEATSHAAGTTVRTLESSMLNNSIGYKIAVISDSAGLMAFITIPWAILTMLTTFLTLPLGFLGTDFAILTYIWGILGIGIIASLAISVAGGRRV